MTLLDLSKEKAWSLPELSLPTIGGPDEAHINVHIHMVRRSTRFIYVVRSCKDGLHHMGLTVAVIIMVNRVSVYMSAITQVYGENMYARNLSLD